MIADGYYIDETLVGKAIMWCLSQLNGFKSIDLAVELQNFGVPSSVSKSNFGKGYYRSQHPSYRGADGIIKMLKRRGLLEYHGGRGAHWRKTNV